MALLNFADQFSGSALSGYWGTYEGAAAPSGGQLSASSTPWGALNTLTPSTPDQEGVMTIGSSGVTAGFVELDFRVNTGPLGYSLGFDIGVGFYLDINAVLDTSTAAPATLAAGDVLRGRVVGNLIQLLYNGNIVLSVVDGTLAGDIGYMGCALGDPSTKIRNVSLHDYVAPTLVNKRFSFPQLVSSC